MISRLLENNITEAFKLKKAVVLLGARQVGKTTLLKKLVRDFENTRIINGDQPDSNEQLSDLSSARLRLNFGDVKNLVIDEAQMIPDIGIILKRIVDYIPNIRIIVSGSSALELANSINEPLTGRKLEYNLFPVSFQEMVNHTSLTEEKRLIPHRLVYGYYPEIVTTPGHEIRLLKNLAGSYLYKDILSFGLIKKPVLLEKLLKALALQIGSEVSYNELSQVIGADKETVERYINLLEKAFIIFQLNALSRNARNEIKKGKKIYFYDIGIRNALIGNFQQFEMRTDKGALWENFIISERIKTLSYSEFYGSYYFWRTFRQQEIDFIEEKDGMFSAYEFKLNPKKKGRFSKTFTEAYSIRELKTISPDNIEEFLLV
ncbi:MAG: ATP-binding protein [Draconibacterium sp.]|nr:ATP-binding protein [Draconibacterium sp.]